MGELGEVPAGWLPGGAHLVVGGEHEKDSGLSRHFCDCKVEGFSIEIVDLVVSSSLPD